MAKKSPWIDDDLEVLQQHVARFVAAKLVPHLGRWEAEGKVDLASWRSAAAAGLFCAAVPEEYGGGGGTLAHEAMIQQELARAGLASSFGICQSIQSGIVAQYVLAYGTEAQKKRWLPRLTSADLIAAIAMTEPGTGSDLKSIGTRAVPVDGGYLLSGQKTFISNGQNTNFVIVVARIGEEPGASALSLFGLETDGAEGFSRGRRLEKLGMFGQDTSELFFTDVFVPADALLGAVAGQGFAQLTHNLSWERIVVALNATVEMERAIELTIAYTRERTAFGKALFEFQNTQFVLAAAKAEATVARAFIDSVMPEAFAGCLDQSTAATAKYWTTETSFKVIDACQQLFGGYGYMVGYPIARLFADARVARVYGGTSEIMKMVIARSL